MKNPSNFGFRNGISLLSAIIIAFTTNIVNSRFNLN